MLQLDYNSILFIIIVTSSGNSRASQKCKSEAYVRKRSSSLPRILPPIFDDDVDDDVGCEFSEEGNTTGMHLHPFYLKRGRFCDHTSILYL